MKIKELKNSIGIYSVEISKDDTIIGGCNDLKTIKTWKPYDIYTIYEEIKIDTPYHGIHSMYDGRLLLNGINFNAILKKVNGSWKKDVKFKVKYSGYNPILRDDRIIFTNNKKLMIMEGKKKKIIDKNIGALINIVELQDGRIACVIQQDKGDVLRIYEEGPNKWYSFDLINRKLLIHKVIQLQDGRIITMDKEMRIWY
jgi:hypothetical protein